MQAKTVKNSSKQKRFCIFLLKNNKWTDFFTGRIIILDYGVVFWPEETV